MILSAMLMSQYLIGQLRIEARRSLSMNIEHYSFLLQNAAPFKAFEEIRKIEIPIILTDSEGTPKFWKKVGISPEDTSQASMEKLTAMVERMDKSVAPIPLELSEGVTDYFHYGDSNLVVMLKMTPYVLIFAVGLFILIGYLGFRNIKDNEQRSVWIGMARETAHQLGTPLTSLLGWMELLKSGQGDMKMFGEMDKDIARLERITARFSQIGSEVKLQYDKINPIVQSAVYYYRRRIPHSGKKIVLIEKYDTDISTMINPYLIGWVLENLIRNGIDAIGEEGGHVKVSVSQQTASAIIDIEDNGCGIDPADRKNIFRPGYTTKHRGWGVGLSLASRIIRDYHGGKIFIKESAPGEGTTIRIILPIKEEQKAKSTKKNMKKLDL